MFHWSITYHGLTNAFGITKERAVNENKQWGSRCVHLQREQGPLKLASHPKNCIFSLPPALFFNSTSIHIILLVLLPGRNSLFKANIWYLKIQFCSAKNNFSVRNYYSISKSLVYSEIDIYILPSQNKMLIISFLFTVVERKRN